VPQRCVSALKKSAYGIFRFFYIFATIGFSLLILLLFTNVVSRNLFNNSFAWIDEITKFIFTWMMFIGISIGVYKKRHIGMEFFTSKLPVRIKGGARTFSGFVTMIFFLILTLFGAKYVGSTMSMYSPILNINYGMVYLCIPLCGILSIFFCMVELMEDKHPAKKPPEGEK